ncbi:MAG: Uma2 family endonuclease [Akkermansiaceae bacterium]|nr:Uma2 family endonuclease [Verrucomicrobiales bacterium]
MQTATQSDPVTVADYLAAEETSEVRHEYLGGLIYAMAGETLTHNQITGNIYLALRQHFKGKPCRVFMSDIRVNFHIREDEYYYYPDIVVTCDSRDTHPRFVNFPKLIVEVLSDSTERVDKREKFFAYTTIASLEEYVLVSQSGFEVTVFRRANGWQSEKISGPEATLLLASLPATVPLSAIYEGV